MLLNAFRTGTDTPATWSRLHPYCLYRGAGQPLPAAPRAGYGPLSDRLQLARTSQQNPSLHNKISHVYQKSAPDLKARAPEPLPPADIRPQDKIVTAVPEDTGNGYWLTVDRSTRRISLPRNGNLVLGHFDPTIGIPPDVDLGFEDGRARTVSRRHAKIVATNGKHKIEDMGSQEGVFLNDRRLQNGPSRPLQVGDRIRLGRVNMTYTLIPTVILNSAGTGLAAHNLMVGATGHKFAISPQTPVIIGRNDSQVDFHADIDLLPLGIFAQRVSRRHARIYWEAGRPHIEDLGSGFGTRLHGKMLLLGKSVPLSPGDHIWLGGCVLVYDVELGRDNAAPATVWQTSSAA